MIFLIHWKNTIKNLKKENSQVWFFNTKKNQGQVWNDDDDDFFFYFTNETNLQPITSYTNKYIHFSKDELHLTFVSLLSKKPGLTKKTVWKAYATKIHSKDKSSAVVLERIRSYKTRCQWDHKKELLPSPTIAVTWY